MKIIKNIFKTIAALLITVILLTVILAITISFSYQDLKAAGISARAAKNNLEAAAQRVTEQNWDSALYHSEQATVEINNSLASLETVKNRQIFIYLTPLRNQVNDLEYLLGTADLIARSLTSGIPTAEKISNIFSSSNNGKFSGLTVREKSELLRLIYESEPELNGLKANLQLASLNLGKIHKIGVLWPFYNQITNFKKEIDTAIALMSQASPIIKLMPALAGYPSASDFLIVMHNNDELRPAGGFIGVFALLNIFNGEIQYLKTFDSYHLDMPAVGKWTMEPPPQIKTYMNVQNWYLRDANWSPDWPSSAQKIQEIFYGESRAIGQETPDFTGIMGITPDFIADLVALVGPIEVRGEIYTPENLQELIQYNVEVAYQEQDISEWDRKDIINDLLEELKGKLFALEVKQLPTLLDIFQKNMLTKDVQIYFNNTNWQSLVYNLQADGAIKKTDKDYLLVVDANLAAFKTDSVIEKGIEYDVRGQNQGMAKAKLKLNYQHNGGFDWRTTRYRSYTRVFAPLGSKLVSLKAQDSANLEAKSINSYDDLALNKTVFGFFFSLEPGSKGAIVLEYDLPENINRDLQSKNYELIIQKQAGRRTNALRVIIDGELYLRNLETDLLIKPN
ncbi:MAG: DUF4012 domain-containing protein [Patescibacteria group bacterium]|jgi:hypothetical protein|nr:DUF4012 domain-containing protein [bacterium]HQC49615.1 DUF4012 domain-containing protein [bacterium]